MGREQLVPAPVPHLHGPLGRARDIGEQHGLQHAIDLMLRSRACQELFDLVERVLVVADPAEVKGAREHRQAGAANVLGEIAPVLERADRVIAAVDNQRRCRDRAKRLTSVDPQPKRLAADAIAGVAELRSRRA